MAVVTGGPPAPDTRESTCSLGSAALQQCGQGQATVIGPQVPTYTVSRLNQLSVLENVCDGIILMPPNFLVGSILGIRKGVQKEGRGQEGNPRGVRQAGT